MTARPPPPRVLRAFGIDESPRPLAGGQGTSWICGGLVLKPGAGPVLKWLAEALGTVSGSGFRLSTPIRTAQGDWSREGWSATRWVAGDEPDLTLTPTWLRIIEAGRAFHRAVAHLPRPACLQARDDRWAIADRVAWGEVTIAIRPEFTSLADRLRAAVEPLGAAQIVHGDLSGNVLFHPPLAPAVIDISPYWRPPAYAEGVVIADALCWHGAPPSLLGDAGVSVPAVARALLFRLVTTSQAAVDPRCGVDVEDELRRYERATAAIGI